MPRKPRYFLPNVPVHVVQRGRNREAVFFETQGYREYLSRLKEATVKYRCRVHAWCLMTNHVHLLVSPDDSDGVTRMMQHLGRHYVPYINQKYGRSGSLWEGRFKASLVDAENYLLACMRYIELNPVVAGMVANAADYRWSSYRCNALGQSDPLVTTHSVYDAQGPDGERLANYRALFDAHQDAMHKASSAIRAANDTGTPLGNDRFKQQVEDALGQKVGQARRGRPTGFKPPRKNKQDKQQRALKGL